MIRPRTYDRLLVAAILTAIAARTALAHKDVKPGEKGAELEKGDPMKLVSDSMRLAEEGLATDRTGDDVQRFEETALSLLDQLIQASSKNPPPNPEQNPQQQPQPNPQKQPQNQDSQKPEEAPEKQPSAQEEQKDKQESEKTSKQPAREDQKQKGAAGNPAEGDLDSAGAEWGTLPPQMRNELFESMQEELPEKYKELLKLYYRELSEGGKR